MLETICPRCKQRYQLGTDHVCPIITVTASKRATVTAPPGYVATVTIPDSSPWEEAEVHDVTGVRIVKRGRPRIHPDRKTYKAQKEREYRARKKAKK